MIGIAAPGSEGGSAGTGFGAGIDELSGEERHLCERAAGGWDAGDPGAAAQSLGGQGAGEQMAGKLSAGDQPTGAQGEQRPGELRAGKQPTGEEGEQRPEEQNAEDQRPEEWPTGEQDEQKPRGQRAEELSAGEKPTGGQISGEQEPGEPSGGEQPPGTQSVGDPGAREQGAVAQSGQQLTVAGAGTEWHSREQHGAQPLGKKGRKQAQPFHIPLAGGCVSAQGPLATAGRAGVPMLLRMLLGQPHQQAVAAVGPSAGGKASSLLWQGPDSVVSQEQQQEGPASVGTAIHQSGAPIKGRGSASVGRAGAFGGQGEEQAGLAGPPPSRLPPSEPSPSPLEGHRGSEGVPLGEALVGAKVQVFSAGDKTWYAGRVTAFKDGQHTVTYKDGESLLHDFAHSDMRLLGRREQEGDAAEDGEGANGGGGREAQGHTQQLSVRGWDRLPRGAWRRTLPKVTSPYTPIPAEVLRKLGGEGAQAMILQEMAPPGRSWQVGIYREMRGGVKLQKGIPSVIRELGLGQGDSLVLQALPLQYWHGDTPAVALSVERGTHSGSMQGGAQQGGCTRSGGGRQSSAPGAPGSSEEGARKRKREEAAEADGTGTIAAAGAWLRLPGGAWRRPFSSNSGPGSRLNIPGAVQQELGIEGTQTVVFREQGRGHDQSRSWRVGVYVSPGCGGWRLQSGFRVLCAGLGLEAGDSLVLEPLPHKRWNTEQDEATGELRYIPTVAVSLEKGGGELGTGAPSHSSGRGEESGKSSAGGSGSAETSEGEDGSGGREESGGSGDSSGGGEEELEEEEEEDKEERVAPAAAPGKKLVASDQPLGHWALAPDGGAWRVIPEHFELSKAICLSGHVADYLGICQGKARLHARLALVTPSPSGQGALCVEASVGPSSGNFGCRLRGFKQWDALGIREGRTLWLGPVVSSNVGLSALPFRVAHAPTPGVARAVGRPAGKHGHSSRKGAADGAPRSEPKVEEGAELGHGAGAEDEAGDREAWLPASEVALEDKWSRPPGGGVWRVVPHHFVEKRRLTVSSPVANYLSIASGTQLQHSRVVLAPAASTSTTVQGQQGCTFEVAAFSASSSYHLRGCADFDQLGLQQGGVLWLGTLVDTSNGPPVLPFTVTVARGEGLAAGHPTQTGDKASGGPERAPAGAVRRTMCGQQGGYGSGGVGCRPEKLLPESEVPTDRWSHAVEKGGVWRLVPGHFVNDRRIVLSVHAAQHLGISRGGTVEHSRFTLRRNGDSSQGVQVTASIPRDAAPCHLKATDFDQLRLETGEVLWLGPLEVGNEDGLPIMPFSVGADITGGAGRKRPREEDISLGPQGRQSRGAGASNAGTEGGNTPRRASPRGLVGRSRGVEAPGIVANAAAAGTVASAAGGVATGSHEEALPSGSWRGREWWRRPADGSLSTTLKETDLKTGVLPLREVVLNALGLHPMAASEEELEFAGPEGRTWEVAVAVYVEQGTLRYLLKSGFAKLLRGLKAASGDILRLWPIQKAAPGRPPLLAFDLERRGSQRAAGEAGQVPWEQPYSSPLAAPSAAAAVAAAAGAWVGRADAVGPSMAQGPQQPLQVQEGDPHILLLELQDALRDAELEPGPFTEFELAWLAGMSPTQQRCIHRAIARAAAAVPPQAAGPARTPAGAAPVGAPAEGVAITQLDGGSGAAKAAVRELALRAVASAQRAPAAAASASQADPHAMLCTLQDQLAGSPGLDTRLFTQFELAWLGPRTGAWWESIARMVGRAQAQGLEPLSKVLAAVARS